MKTIVIYDSVIGNTEKVAQSIAAALDTQAVPVSQANAEQLRGLDLLAVGVAGMVTQGTNHVPHDEAEWMDSRLGRRASFEFV
jgi:flavodoxin